MGVIKGPGRTCTCRATQAGVSLAFQCSFSIAFPTMSKGTYCETRKRASGGLFGRNVWGFFNF